MHKFLVLAIIISMASSAAFAQAVDATNPFTDYGVGAPVAEARGIVTTQTADGRSLVIACALDQSKIGYIVVTDIDSGETRQYYNPDDLSQSAPYGSLMAANGRFYTAQGTNVLEFDPLAKDYLWHGTPTPAGCYLSFTEDTDGNIYGGGLGCWLFAYNPKTQETRNYGRLDNAEQYLYSLAVDDKGWIYGGIGTARQNIAACNIETGEIRQLIADEERVLGTASVYASIDGKCYGTVNSKQYRLYDGAAELITAADKRPMRDIHTVYYGQMHKTFPDGRQLTAYSMPDKWLKIFDPKTGETRRIEFEYESGGASITSLGVGPGGIVYGSTCHPMHFLSFDANKRELTDFGSVPGIGGGNMCAITSQGDHVIGAVYSSGTMWDFNINVPFNPNGARDDFPISAEQLMKMATATDGHFTFLDSQKLAFFHGDKWGATGSFTFNTPKDGSYYLYMLPYTSNAYGRMKLTFDEHVLSDNFDFYAADTAPGTPQEFGPFELKAGAHTFTMTALETPERSPWCSISSMYLSQQRVELPNILPTNPRILAEWHDDVCRPRTALAHPDGEHVLMAGYAGYGLCGGGIGIYNLKTNEAQLLSAEDNLLPGHSCITLKALQNGDLVGGTSIAAPGGGHTTATEAEIFILDWKTKEVTFSMVPVPGQTSIESIWVMPDDLVYGLTTSGWFFVFDPVAKKIVHTEDLTTYGGVPRHALQQGPDGNLYAMFRSAIVRITPGTFEHELLAKPPVGIQAGGALVNGMLIFANGSNVWSYDIPGID